MNSATDLHDKVASIIGHGDFDGVVLFPNREFSVSGVSDAELDHINDEFDNLTLRRPTEE